MKGGTVGGSNARHWLLGCALFAGFVVGCSDEQVDKPAVKALKAECREILKHIVEISPQTQGRDAGSIAAALPVEDVEGCVASEPEIRSCMRTASDIGAVRKCIPTNEVLTCMQAAAQAKDDAHEQAKKSKKTVDDAPYDLVRAKCWAGDATSVEQLKSIRI